MTYLFAMHPNNRLRELRKRAGLTQVELADRAGISQAAISQVENDSRPLTVDWMRIFARILDCTVADLLGDADNPHRPNQEERELIEHFRAADLAQRAMIRRVAEPLQGYRQQDPEPADGRLRPRNAA